MLKFKDHIIAHTLDGIDSDFTMKTKKMVTNGWVKGEMKLEEETNYLRRTDPTPPPPQKRVVKQLNKQFFTSMQPKTKDESIVILDKPKKP